MISHGISSQQTATPEQEDHLKKLDAQGSDQLAKEVKRLTLTRALVVSQPELKWVSAVASPKSVKGQEDGAAELLQRPEPP